MAMDRAEARAELWRRYDAGEISARDVEVRLGLLERAGDDESALRDALERRVPPHRRASTRRAIVAGAAVIAVLLLAGAAVAVVGGGDDDAISTGGSGRFPENPVPFEGGGAVATIVVEPGVAPPPPPDCPEGERQQAGADEAAASPALLSDPPFLPEGYELDGDDDAIIAGNDPDLTMSVAAGDPLPVEILARVLDGDLPVRMRAFRHEDPEHASAAVAASARSACGYAATYFEVPDRPEIGGAVVTGVIPTTAFASWQLGDRRFLVAVEAEGDGEDDIEEARVLAGLIAGGELDAARGR
jgi:hypothetical protein